MTGEKRVAKRAAAELPRYALSPGSAQRLRDAQLPLRPQSTAVLAQPTLIQAVTNTRGLFQEMGHLLWARFRR